MRGIGRLLTAALVFGVSVSATAADEEGVKRVLKANRTLSYKVTPPSVTNLAEMLKEGVFYGRLRLNTFRWDWAQEIPGKTRDNWAVGVGGSLMYRSAYWHGFAFAIDGYTSQNPWHMDEADIKYLKAGKDVLSRYDVYHDGDYFMNVVAQLYAEYRLSQTRIRYGRQKFESFLTRSNNTKMIPNTFEGLTLVSGDLPHHRIKLAWLTKQKLRDHTTFHDPLTYADRSLAGLTTEEKLLAIWANNDDAGMHRGLSWDNYVAAGLEPDNHDLLVAEVWSMAVPGLKAMVNYTAVPDVLASATVEAHYTLTMPGEYRLVPGVRYMHQFDNGGGAVGGASLTGLIGPYGAAAGQSGGYDDPYSLEGWLVAARIDLKSDAPWSMRLGYSHVGDKADIVAPWRGFPTGGFTRAMGQYNWTANTDTWMLEGRYDFAKAGWVEGLEAMFRLATEDYDQGKYVLLNGTRTALQLSDRVVLHLDAIYRVPALRGLEARVRMAFVNADDRFDGTDPSYNEYRFEMNYLF